MRGEEQARDGYVGGAVRAARPLALDWYLRVTPTPTAAVAAPTLQ